MSKGKQVYEPNPLEQLGLVTAIIIALVMIYVAIYAATTVVAMAWDRHNEPDYVRHYYEPAPQCSQWSLHETYFTHEGAHTFSCR